MSTSCSNETRAANKCDAIAYHPVSLFKHDEYVKIGIRLEIAASLGAKQPNADDTAIAPLKQTGCEFLKGRLLVSLQVGGETSHGRIPISCKACSTRATKR